MSDAAWEIRHWRGSERTFDELSERAARKIESLEAQFAAARREIEQWRRQCTKLNTDSESEARDSATEAQWKERQGEDYGSY